MKKNKLICLAILLVSLLAACGNDKIDPVSQKVINDIDAIGTVDLDDEELINIITEVYSTLTDEQKNQVTNYAIFLEKKDELNTLKIAKEEEENAYLYFERNYYSTVDDAISMLKANIVNPGTLNVLEIIVYHNDDGSGDTKPSVAIQFSSENNSGKTITSVCSYSYWSDDFGYQIAINNEYFNYDQYHTLATEGGAKSCYQLAKNFYSSSESLDEFDETGYYYFLVVLDDYDSYK